jgi:hypothetical protein
MGEMSVLDMACERLGMMREDSEANHAGEARKKATTREDADEAGNVRAAAAKVGTRRSVDSRKKIAEAQRARWRKARREVDLEPESATSDTFDPTALDPTKPAKSRKTPVSSARTDKLTKLIAMKKSTSRAEKQAFSSVKVNQFSSELSKYTKLRNELASWSDGFEETKGRRPTLKDVQNTRIPWLIESFQEYVRLRNKLIAQTPNIRGEVGRLAKATLPSPRSLPSGEIRLSIDDDNDDDDDGDGGGDDGFSVFNFRN